MSSFGFNVGLEHTKSQARDFLFCDDFTHSVCYGPTGSGKTLGYVNNLIANRIQSNYALLFFDYKGKEASLVKYIATKHHREHDIIEFGYPWSAYTINLLAQLSENSLNTLLLSLLGDNLSGDNAFWNKQAVSMIMAVAKIVNIGNKIQELLDEDLTIYLTAVSKNSKTFNPLFATVSFDNYTFSELYSYFEDKTKFFVLISNADALSLHILAKVGSKKSSLDNASKKYLQQLLMDLERSKESLKQFSSFSLENQEASGDNGVYFCARGPLGVLSRNIYINAQESTTGNINTTNTLLTIDKMLDAGKIIIVNCEGMRDEMLCEILNSTLLRLSRRAKFFNKTHRATSVVIDEANRVLSLNADLHTDILRESRVEINIVGQNKEQFFLKFGTQKWLSFELNLTRKILFNKGYAPNKKEPFYYKEEGTGSRAAKATAYSVTNADKYNTERAFQLQNPILAPYIKKDGIAIFDDLKFELDRKVAIFNMEGACLGEIPIVVAANNKEYSAKMLAKKEKEESKRKRKEGGKDASRLF